MLEKNRFRNLFNDYKKDNKPLNSKLFLIHKRHPLNDLTHDKYLYLFWLYIHSDCSYCIS